MNNSNIIVAQFYTNNVLYGKYSEGINRDYCEKNGYKYISETNTNKITMACEGRSFTWFKPKFIKEIFEIYNPEYVLFLDADAILVNRNIKIEDFIDENYEIIFAEDIGGTSSHSAMNAGAFIIKNTNFSKDFLEQWWNLGDTLKGKDGRNLTMSSENKEKTGYFREGLWHDQTCLTYLYEHNESIHKKLKIISNESFNYYEYNENKFMFHAFRYGVEPFRTIDIRYNEILNSQLILPNINLIVYHIFAKNNFKEIVESQINRIIKTGLYDWCDKMEITFTGEKSDLDLIAPIFSNLEKINITITPDNRFEYYAINTIWEYSQKFNGKVFYFHTKGVSNNYKDIQSMEISERKVQGIKWWKEILEKFLIDKWEECINVLDKYDQCGVTNAQGWWWGNFWWSNLSWVRSNTKPYCGDRWYFEAWLNNYRDPKIYEWYHFTFNPYFSILPNDIYDVEKYKDSEIVLIKAEYGTIGIQTDEAQLINERVMIDATEKIKNNFISNNRRGFNFFVSNDIAGDPNHGFKKIIEIVFKIDEKEYILVASEGQFLNFIL